MEEIELRNGRKVVKDELDNYRAKFREIYEKIREIYGEKVKYHERDLRGIPRGVIEINGVYEEEVNLFRRIFPGDVIYGRKGEKYKVIINLIPEHSYELG